MELRNIIQLGQIKRFAESHGFKADISNDLVQIHIPFVLAGNWGSQAFNAASMTEARAILGY